MNGLLCLVLLSLTGVCLAEVQMTLEPAGIIKQGDTLKITCSAPNKAMFDVVKVIRVVDVYESATGKKEKKTNILSQNGQSQNGNPDNYEAEEVDDTTYTFTITNVQGGDGGEIGCEHLSMENGAQKRDEAMEFVTVHVPATVELRAKQDDGDWMPVMEGDKIVMREGHMDGIQCFVEANGAEPEVHPKIHFKAGSKDFKGVNGVKHEVESHGKLLDDNTRELHYQSHYEYVTDKPDRHFGDKEIVCSAHMKQFDVVSRKAILDVQYPPTVKCPKSTYAKLGEQASLTCTVKLNPVATESSWSWTAADGNTSIVKSGESSNGVSAEEVAQGDAYEFSLVFSSVEVANFGEYTFTVDNGLGDSVVSTAKFLEDESTPEPEPSTTTPAPTQAKVKSEEKNDDSDPALNESTGSATGIAASMVTLLIAAIFARSL